MSWLYLTLPMVMHLFIQLPEHPIKLILPIITLVGGTVGGYITFAGAHRILDSGMKGKEFLPFVNRSAIAGILTTGTENIIILSSTWSCSDRCHF